MNLIAEKTPRIEWYTDLYPFFCEIESIVRSHAWLWTDIDINTQLPILEDKPGVIWISGDAIFEFTANHPQFIWSVFSAISSATVDAAKALDCIPHADGNPDFWVGSPTPQHPNAVFEIVCWDSSATLLIGADQTIANAFRRAYPDVRDLDAENAVRSNYHAKS